MGGNTDEEEEKGGEANPNFEVIPIIRKPKIDAGEEIIIDYYFVGRSPGNRAVQRARMNVNFSGINHSSALLSQNIGQQFSSDGHNLKMRSC